MIKKAQEKKKRPKILAHDATRVFYEDDHGFSAPLAHLLYYNGPDMHKLICRHPTRVTEEFISTYCPQCMTTYHVDESKFCRHCFNCAECNAPIRTQNYNSINYFFCEFCYWVCDLQISCETDSSEFDMRVFEKINTNEGVRDDYLKKTISKYEFLSLNNNSFQGGSVENRKQAEYNDRPQQMYRAEEEIISKPKIFQKKMLPLRQKLRSKRTIRYRKEQSPEFRSIILCQPKPMPLEVFLLNI